MARSSRKKQQDPSWAELARVYPDHPALREEAIYALPNRLIDAIRLEVPSLIAATDLAFERDLARLAEGGGFFWRRRFTYNLLPQDPPDPRQRDSQLPEISRRQQVSEAAIRELLEQEARTAGQADVDIPQLQAHEAELARRIQERQRGYVGWLVTSPHFHLLREGFRRRWEKRVRDAGHMPAVPKSLLGERPRMRLRTPEDREYFAGYMNYFCGPLCLESLVTWDLPLPMHAELAGPHSYPLESLSEAGLVLFVPWYLFADKSLTLGDLAQHRRAYGLGDHLREWLEPGKDWGYERFGVMLRLYVYLELALRARYRGRLKGMAEKLDRAFTRFVTDEEDSLRVETKLDSIRRIRLELDRRLKRCRAALEEVTDGS